MQLVVFSLFVLHIVSFYPSCILMYVHDKEELFCVYFEEHKRCFFIFLKKDDFFWGEKRLEKLMMRRIVGLSAAHVRSRFSAVVRNGHKLT